MKKLITGFLSVLLLMTGVSAEETPAPSPLPEAGKETAVPEEGTEENGTTEETPEPEPVWAVDVSTDYAVLIDADSGKVLFEKNKDTARDPASLTKIMTVYLAMKTLTSPSQEITMSKEAFQTYDHNQGVLWIQEGETLSAKDCEYATMLASANDTAAMLAEAAALSQDGFVQKMNAEAKDMNLEATVFDNIFGLSSPGNQSSAYDIAKLTRQALKNDAFREIFGASGYTIPATNKQPQSRPIAQDCELLRNGEYSWEEATGGKIGSTKDGGFCLAASAKRGATSLIAVVLSEETADNAYHDIVRIFEYGFQNAQTVTITAEQIGTKTVEVMDGGKHVADVVFSADSGFSILLPKDIDPDGLKAEIVVANETASSPERITAEVQFTLNGELIGSAQMEKKVVTVKQEETVIEKSGGFRMIFDYACIIVLVLVLLLPPLVKFLTSLQPPE